MSLTDRQRQIMDHLAGFIQEHGYSPTYEELAEHLGYRSLATVHEHVRKLVAKGLLRVQYQKKRSIEVVRTDDRARAYASAFPPREWLQEPCDDRPLSPVPHSAGEGLAEIRRYRERWNSLRSQLRPGDRIWTFRSPGADWERWAGRAGYAVVREGVVVDGVVTHDQLMEPNQERQKG